MKRLYHFGKSGMGLPSMMDSSDALRFMGLFAAMHFLKTCIPGKIRTRPIV